MKSIKSQPFSFRVLNYSLLLSLLLFTASCEKEDTPEVRTPSAMKISQIKVTNYPLTSGGVPWDDPIIGSATGPDVTWKIVGPQNFETELLLTQASGEDITFTVDPPIFLSGPTSSYTIQLWDVDDLDGSDLGSSDDLMTSLTFTPWSEGTSENIELLTIYNSIAEVELVVDFLFD